MRQTSIEAWRSVFAKLNGQRRAALEAIVEHPGMTAAELETAGLGRRHWNKRLSELERRRLVSAREARTCAITGHMSLTWWPTTPELAAEELSRPAPRALSWKSRALQAEARLRTLEASAAGVSL